MLDRVFDCVNLNPLPVYELHPHEDLQLLHVCHCYGFSHQTGKKAQIVIDCVHSSQDKKDNYQSDVQHYGKTSFSLSQGHCLVMEQELGTDLLQKYNFKMTLHYYSLSQSALHLLLKWEAPQ